MRKIFKNMFSLFLVLCLLGFFGTAWGAAGDPVLAPIMNAHIDASALIDATKIADGSVSSVEFQYLDGLGEDIKSTLDAKSPAASPTFTGTVVLPSNQALLGSPTIATSIDPDEAAGATIGSATKEWTSLYLTDGGVIYGQAGQEVSLTSSATGWASNLNIEAATYGSDGTISDAELLGIDDGADTEILVGGGAGSIAVWTTATGTGAPVRGTSPTFTTKIKITGADADPTAAGDIVYDSTITDIMSGGGLRWFDNDSVRLIVDLEADPADDDYVVAYDSTADGFYMKVDVGGTPGTFGSETAKTLVTDVADASGGENFLGLAGEGAAADDIVEITAVAAGDIIVLSNPNAGSYAITVKDDTYMKIQADFILDSVDDTITLICDSIGEHDTFREISRANNG